MLESNQGNIKLQALTLKLRTFWFPMRADLDQYQVRWSRRRQIHTLASCQLETKRIFVADLFNQPRYAIWIEPLLYHELCHAAIGFDVETSQRGRRAWHGNAFRQLEQRHPLTAPLNAWIKQGGWQQAVKKYHSANTTC